MTEFEFQGQLTLDGVRFYVKAETKEGALARIAWGDYDSYDIDRAQSVGEHIAASSIQENA